MEGAEDRRIGGSLGGLLVDHLDQHRQTERVGQQDELLALVVALVADRGEEIDPGEPLLTGQTDFLGEGEEVLDGGSGEFTDSVVAGWLYASSTSARWSDVEKWLIGTPVLPKRRERNVVRTSCTNTVHLYV